MEFKKLIAWKDRDVFFLFPTIVFVFWEPRYNCKTFAIQVHFLFWNLRWFWMEEEHGRG